MNDRWNKIKNIVSGLRDLTTIGIIDVVSNGIAAIFWFYMAAVLSVEQYGQISYFIAVAGIASTVSLLGSENTLTVFTAKNVKIQSTIYLITIISGSIASIVVFFILYKLEVSLLVIGYVIFALAISEILGRKLYMTYSKYVITHKILTVGLAVGLYYLIGTPGVIAGIALSSFPYAIRLYKGFKESKVDFSLLKSRFGFMMTNYMMVLSSAFSGSFDKLIIAPLLGFAILGNYQLGLQFLSVLLILPSIVYKYILPQDASGNANTKLKKLTILSSVGLAVLGIFLSPLLIPVAFPKFTQAVGVIQIISVSIIPTSINLIYTSRFLANENNRIVLYGSIMYEVIQIVTIIILGKIFGVNGIAIALVISVSSQTIFFISANRFIKAKMK